MQVPLSMGCPKQEFPSPGDLSDPWSEPTSPALQAWRLLPNHLGRSYIYTHMHTHIHIHTSLFFLDSILTKVITEYSAEFSVLYSSFISVIYSIYVRVYMSVPVSQFYPLCLTPFVTIIFTAEVICYFFPVVSNVAKDSTTQFSLPEQRLICKTYQG